MSLPPIGRAKQPSKTARAKTAAIQGEPCLKCPSRQPHDPKRCQAHSLRQEGNQCRAWPVVGMDICETHGGATPGAIGARDDNALMQQALTEAVVIAKPGPIRPIIDPLAALQELAGEAKWWKEVLVEAVTKLKTIRYSTDGGEAIRGEVLLFERALDRLGAFLIAMAKLNIDERLVRIEEQRRDMVLAALEAGFVKAGLTGQPMLEAKAETARRLRVLSRTIDNEAA